MATQSPASSPDIHTAEATPSVQILPEATTASVAENVASDVDEADNVDTESQASLSESSVAADAEQNAEGSNDEVHTEEEEITEHDSQKTSKLRRALKAVFTITNLLISSIGFAFAIICYRYIKWTALKDFRDDCRATAASGQNITEACSKALLGSMSPPPFRLSSTEATCGDFDEEIFREFLLSETDRLFPFLWQYLLFEVGQVPDRCLSFFATMLLPTYFLAWYLHMRFMALDIKLTPRLALQASIWLFSYQVIGLTGIWLTLSKSIISGIQWVVEDQTEWSNVVAVIAAACWSYDAVRVVVASCALYWAIGPLGGLRSRTVDETVSWYGTFTTTYADDEVDDLPEKFDMTGILATLAMSLVIILAGSLPSWIGYWAIFGPRIMALFGTILTMYALTIVWVEARNSERVTGRVAGTVGNVVLFLALFGIYYCAGAVVTKHEDHYSDADAFWRQYFCDRKNERDLRLEFQGLIDTVLQQEQIVKTFNATVFKALREHSLFNDRVMPEMWRQVKDFIQWTGEINNEDWLWFRDEE